MISYRWMTLAIDFLRCLTYKNVALSFVSTPAWKYVWEGYVLLALSGIHLVSIVETKPFERLSILWSARKDVEFGSTERPTGTNIMGSQ